MTPEQVQQAIAARLEEANNHLNWLHGIQAQPGNSPDENPELEAAIRAYQGQYNDIAGLANKPAVTQAEIDAKLHGLEASAQEAEARARQIAAQTAQIGQQTPDSAASNATSLQIANMQANTAAGNQQIQREGQANDFTIKSAQNELAARQIDLTRLQQEALNSAKSGDQDIEKTKLALTQAENALNRAIQVYQIQVTQAGQDQAERGNIRSTEQQARSADVGAAATTGQAVGNAFRDFRSNVSPVGYTEYIQNILGSGGDMSKVKPWSPQPVDPNFSVEGMIRGATARERESLASFQAPQYTRGDQPGGGPSAPTTLQGSTIPTVEQVRENPYSHLDAGAPPVDQGDNPEDPQNTYQGPPVGPPQAPGGKYYQYTFGGQR